MDEREQRSSSGTAQRLLRDAEQVSGKRAETPPRHPRPEPGRHRQTEGAAVDAGQLEADDCGHPGRKGSNDPRLERLGRRIRDHEAHRGTAQEGEPQKT